MLSYQTLSASVLHYGLIQITSTPHKTIASITPLFPHKQDTPFSKLQTPHPTQKQYVLPLGNYQLTLQHDGYKTFQTNVHLSKENHHIHLHLTLQLTPLTLILKDLPENTSIYLNQKYLTTYHHAPLTLTNLPGGEHQLLLIKKKSFYHQTLSSYNHNPLRLTQPKLIHVPTQAILAASLGLLPGMNAFIHVPKSSLSVLIPLSVLFYLSVAITLTEDLKTFRWISPTEEAVNPTVFYVMISLSSLLHALFVYNGVIQDTKQFFPSKSVFVP